MTFDNKKMSSAFQFLKPGKLVDGDLRLTLVKRHPADPTKGHVPWYQFDMRKVGNDAKMGRISLRIGSLRILRCPGHIGYKVNKKYRGHRYAARACRLLFPFALAHGFHVLWINCDPKNTASARTLELAGAKYVETIRIPKAHEMYKQGGRYLRRHRINVKKKLSNNRLHRTRLPKRKHVR